MKTSILRFPSSGVLGTCFFASLRLLYFALRAIRLKAMRVAGMRGSCLSPQGHLPFICVYLRLSVVAFRLSARLLHNH